VIRKDEQVVCPVDETGCFTSEVTDFKGQYVKVGYMYLLEIFLVFREFNDLIC